MLTIKGNECFCGGPQPPDWRAVVSPVCVAAVLTDKPAPSGLESGPGLALCQYALT